MDELLQDDSAKNPLDELLSEQEKETPSESSPEEKPVEPTPSSEGDNTQDEDKQEQLDRHPRFKEVIREKNNYKKMYEDTTSKLDETNHRLDEMQSFIQRFQDSTPNQEVTIPNEFVSIYGSNEPQTFQEWKKLMDQVFSEKLKQYEATKAQQQEVLRKQNQDYENLVEQYRQQYDEQIGELSKEHGFDKNTFKAWFIKNPIMNEQGTDYNFEKAVHLFLMENPKKHSRRELGEKPSYAESPAGYKHKTLEELARMSWNQIGN